MFYIYTIQEMVGYKSWLANENERITRRIARRNKYRRKKQKSLVIDLIKPIIEPEIISPINELSVAVQIESNISCNQQLNNQSKRLHDIYIDDKIDLDNQQSFDALCLAIMTIYFSGNMTQNATEMLLLLLQICTETNLPKTFRTLYKKISTQELSYEKIFYCEKCHKRIEISKFKNRRCKICNKWYIYFFFHINSIKLCTNFKDKYILLYTN